VRAADAAVGIAGRSITCEELERNGLNCFSEFTSKLLMKKKSIELK
jgi:hypothetical protein